MKLERQTENPVLTVIMLMALLSVSALLFFPLFRELHNYYRADDEYQFAYIIPLFSLYFLWLQRRKLMELQLSRNDTSFSLRAVMFLVPGLCLYLVATYIYVPFFQGFSLILVVASSILFLYGKELFKITLAPLLFLLFMLPLPDPVYVGVSDPLKFMIAELSTLLLSILNVPVFLDGNVIHLPSISLMVHETCSGLRTIISLFAVSSAFAYLFMRSYRYRITFVLMSIPLGIAVNLLRVFIIGLLAYYYDNQLAMSFHEYAFGLVTPVGIVMTFFLGNIFRCHDRSGT